MAIIDAQRLDYYHQFESGRIHLLLVGDAGACLSDIAAGSVKNAETFLTGLKPPPAAKAPTTHARRKAKQRFHGAA